MVGKERKGNEEPQGDREHNSDGKGLSGKWTLPTV